MWKTLWFSTLFTHIIHNVKMTVVYPSRYFIGIIPLWFMPAETLKRKFLKIQHSNFLSHNCKSISWDNCRSNSETRKTHHQGWWASSLLWEWQTFWLGQDLSFSAQVFFAFIISLSLFRLRYPQLLLSIIKEVQNHVMI